MNKLEKQGMGEVRLGGKTTVLHGTFENLDLYETTSKSGIYAMLHRVGTGDVRASDLVNIIWCFSYDRDTEGWTKDDIMKIVFAASPQEIISVVGGFLNSLFTTVETGVEGAEGETKKKTTRRPRS